MAGFIDYQLDPMGQPRYFGVYRGTVIDTADPLSKSRVRLAIPMIFGNAPTGWAEAVLPPVIETVMDSTSTPQSNVVLPSAGSKVWVMFEAGNPDFPVWIGSRV